MNTLYTVPTIVFTSDKRLTKSVTSNVIWNLGIFKTHIIIIKFLLSKLNKRFGIVVSTYSSIYYDVVSVNNGWSFNDGLELKR